MQQTTKNVLSENKTTTHILGQFDKIYRADADGK